MLHEETLTPAPASVIQRTSQRAYAITGGDSESFFQPPSVDTLGLDIAAPLSGRVSR